jgi:hypothetical protein
VVHVHAPRTARFTVNAHRSASRAVPTMWHALLLE